MADPVQITVQIRPPLGDVAEQYGFSPRMVRRIGADAVNRTLPTVRSRVSFALADKINLPRTQILDQLQVTRATPETLSGRVSVSRNPIALSKFKGTRQLKAGVRVEVMRGKPELLKGTFLSQLKSGHTGVFERGMKLPTGGPNAGARLVRHGKDGRKPGDPKYRLIPGRQYRAAGRLTIVERFGITLTGYLQHTPQLIADEQAASADALAKNLASQISRRDAERKK